MANGARETAAHVCGPRNRLLVTSLDKAKRHKRENTFQTWALISTTRPQAPGKDAAGGADKNRFLRLRFSSTNGYGSHRGNAPARLIPIHRTTSDVWMPPPADLPTGQRFNWSFRAIS